MATHNYITLFALIISLAAYTNPAIATESSELAASVESAPRVSTSTFQGKSQKYQYPANTSKTEAPQNNKRTIQNHNHGIWIFDVLISLTADNDHDGHYSTFSVTLDVESSFQPRTVYAVLYLSHEGGPWLEYAVTGNFTVSGSSASDSVQIETSLESGYPSGYYDHYVEIYDAYDHSLLLSYGSEQSHHYRWPFESYYNDSYNSSYESSATVSLSFSGTGSTTIHSLVGLLSMLGLRRRLYKNNAT